MDKVRILQLADFMEVCSLGFTMKSTLNEVDEQGCGTAGCIMGHAARLWPSLRSIQMGIIVGDEHRYEFYCREGLFAKHLNLRQDQFESLAIPSEIEDGVSYMSGEIDKAWAIRTLRYLAKTGKVDWNATREKSDAH